MVELSSWPKKHLITLLLLFFCRGNGENILFVSISDKGHILPLIHIAKLLHGERNITFVSTCDAQSLIEKEGFSFFCIGQRQPDSLLGGNGYPHFFDLWKTFGWNFLYSAKDYYRFLRHNCFQDDSKLMQCHFPNHSQGNKLTIQQFDFMVTDILTFGATMASHDIGIPAAINAPMYMTNPVDDPWLFPAWSFGKSIHMSLIERIENIFNHAALYIGYSILQLGMTPERGLQAIFTNLQAELFKSNPILYNFGFPFDYPRPIGPLSIMTGPLNHLPKFSVSTMFPNFRFESTLVYISFGTTTASLPKAQAEQLKIGVRALCNIGVKFIWSSASFHENNDTCITWVNWVHQPSVLADKNVKAFISHAGLNGVMESLQHGVPILLYPLYGDQPDVAIRIKDLKVGLILEKTFRSDEVVSSIQLLLSPQWQKRGLDVKNMLNESYNSTAALKHHLNFFIKYGYQSFVEQPSLSFTPVLFSLLLLYSVRKVCIG